MSKRLSDNVLARMVQAFQEALFLGVDCSDVLRQVRVVESEEDPNTLDLCPEYVKQVKAMHEKLIKEAEELQAAQQKSKLIIDAGSD